jgi:hypothetical protein
MTKRPSRRGTDGPLRGAHQALRAQFLQRCVARPCQVLLQRRGIDHSLRHPDPGAFEVHHTIPVAVAPQYEMEVSLWAPRACLLIPDCGACSQD